MEVCSISCSRERQLGVLDRHLRDRAHLPRCAARPIVELLHDEDAVHRPHQHQILLASRRVLAQRRAAGVLERLGEQPVGSLATLVGAEEVRLLEVEAVHLGEGNELVDVDGVRGLLVERLDLLGREDDVLALGELVSLGDLVPLHDLVVLGADVLLLEPGAVLLVHHVEADVGGGLAGGIEIDRDRNQSERDRGRGH